MWVEFVVGALLFLLIFEIDFRANGDLDCLLLTAQLKRREIPITSPIRIHRPGSWNLPPQPPAAPTPTPVPATPPVFIPAPLAGGVKAAPPTLHNRPQPPQTEW